MSLAHKIPGKTLMRPIPGAGSEPALLSASAQQDSIETRIADAETAADR